jgi:hypothetical protein
VRRSFQHFTLYSGIEIQQSTALGDDTQGLTIGAPSHTGREVGKRVVDHVRLLVFDIPNSDCQVSSVGSEYIISDPVPSESQNFLGVSFEDTIPLLNMIGDTFLRDDPKFAATIFGGRSEKSFNEGGECYICDCTSVTLNQGQIALEALEIVGGEHSDGGVSLPGECCEDAV